MYYRLKCQVSSSSNYKLAARETFPAGVPMMMMMVVVVVANRPIELLYSTTLLPVLMMRNSRSPRTHTQIHLNLNTAKSNHCPYTAERVGT